ncbi:MAG TPA: IPT/TIG domain-containing protein [Candidatus Acidoferrum sp.]|nr:IPT/TIG domain-containing protein [Candidatus Acidoferrum sp.]
MRRLRVFAPIFLLVAGLQGSCGCGGGAASLQPPSPPPQPDFSIAFSANSINLQQGTTSSTVNLSLVPVNGFAGSVQVNLSALPSGVASSPASPFHLSAGSNVSFLFSAASNAAPGNFTITATGTSGSLSHPASLGVTVQPGVRASLPRTTYTRTDSIPEMDDPSGEFHHRHLAYDSTHGLVFAANCGMNRVDIFSTATATLVGQVSVPGASSADLSADGSTVWIGTVTEQLVALNPSSLEVKHRYAITGLLPLPNVLFDRPEEVLALADGNVLVRLRESQAGMSLPALWNPSANSLTNLTSTEPQLFQNGLGAMARTGDQSKVLIAASDSSGEVATYDSNGNVLAGPHGLGNGAIPLVAANPDGSRFAVEFTVNGVPQVLLLDGSLNQVAAYASAAVDGMVFSRDGQTLFISENTAARPVITALDGHNLQVLGQVPDLTIGGRRTEIEDVDNTNFLFGIANRGIAFLDAGNPGSLITSAPIFSAPPVLQPSEGPNSGGTAITLTGQNFAGLTQLSLGAQLATGVGVVGSTKISATSPPNAANGAVNATAYFSNGWLALAPDAFSYGPRILQVLPNAGVQSGGDTIQVYGYGFGTDPGKVSVQIGASAASILKVENISAIASSLGLDSSYPFPLERITLQTPPGTAGLADISISSPAGSATLPDGFQFLQSLSFFAKPALEKFILYDPSRQWLYLSNIDHVDVFDLAAKLFRGTPLQPPGGPPPNAALRGLALTPDDTQLIAADFGAQNVYLLSPDSGGGASVPVGGVPGFAQSGPSRIAATSTHDVFVGLSGESSASGGCTSCLGQLNLSANPPVIQPASQPEISSLTGAPYVQSSLAGSQVFVAFASAPGGPLAFWNAAAPNQFSTFTANDAAQDMAAAADGTLFALEANGNIEIRGSDLSLSAVIAQPELLRVPGRVFVPGIALHPSGALLYVPFLSGTAGAAGTKGGIDILDARTGMLRLRIFLPQQFMTDVDGLHGSFLTVDQNGQRLFAITSTDGTPQNAGVSVVTLANVPLGIGTLSPSNAAATGGTEITIRGTGFQSGAAVTIGGKSASTTFVDMNTLTFVLPALPAGAQRVTVTNPNGDTYSLDAAFTAN